MERFSVLITSYRENERLYNLIKTILSDKLRRFIEKIIVVTPDCVKLPKSKKILLIKEKKRRGRHYAINLGLKKVNTNILVMVDSDIRMRKNFLQYLIKHFNDPKIGMVTGRPIADKNSNLYPFAKIIWDLHHFLCLKEPKGTAEICAFRKIFDSIPEVIADDVFIEYTIKNAGYKLVYEQLALGYVKIPHSLSYFLYQRSRCFFSNFEIFQKYKFKSSSMNFKNLLQCTLGYLKSDKKFSTFLMLFLVVQFEIFARITGLLHFLVGKNYIVWKKE